MDSESSHIRRFRKLTRVVVDHHFISFQFTAIERKRAMTWVNSRNMTTLDTFSLLKISNSTTLNQFLHECVDDLLGRKANFDNYNSGDVEWTKEDYDNTRKSIQNFYRQCIVEDNFYLDKETPPNLEEAIRQCYEIRKNDIFQIVAKECVLNLGHNLVDNIDWKLKWILGTSDLATAREPLLQVDLHCSQRSGTETKRNTVNFEADLPQIDNLIKSLTELQNELS